MGHLTRCRALAGALKRRARSARFEFWVDTEYPAASLGGRAGAFKRFRGLASARFEALVRGARRRFDVAIVDHKSFGAASAKRIRPIAARVVRIHDGSGKPRWADLVFSPRFARKRPRRSAGYYEGREFIILKESFGRKRHAASRRKDDVFVCFGGTDPNGITEKVVRDLSSDRGTGRFVVVAGAGKKGIARLKKILPRPRFMLKRGVPDVQPLLSRCRFSLTSGGTLLYEACASGCPPLVIGQNAEQAGEARAVQALGAAVYLGWHDSYRKDRLRRLMKRMSEDDAFRARLARRGRAFIDGKGAARIADRVIRLCRGGAS